MKIIKYPFVDDDSGLPLKLMYEVENDGHKSGHIHFTNYRTNGYEVHLKQGDIVVATLIMKQKELAQFKELYKKVTERR